ncbi:unnamed protein product [Rotaria sp. Silwood2]|nr:unnamed protein product [Rotaria sp. Silwood2]CAF4673736.1 unnamed protein product [Rotaria sp. Silwood2]
MSNCQSTNRWLININMIFQCLVQNLTEDAILTRWNEILSSVNGTRDETTLLRIVTNTRQLCDRIDMTLVSLASDYLYVLMHIMENGNESK